MARDSSSMERRAKSASTRLSRSVAEAARYEAGVWDTGLTGGGRLTLRRRAWSSCLMFEEAHSPCAFCCQYGR